LSSILKAQFEQLSDDEVLQRASYLKSCIWRILAFEPPDEHEQIVSLLNKIQRLRTKFSWVLLIVTERNLAFEDDGLLEYCKQRLIDVAKEKKVCPIEFGESFESLGVSDPWTFKTEASVIDLEFQERKDALKKAGILFIKNNPSCTEADLQAYLDANYSIEDASLGKYLMVSYQNWSYKRGLITENTFDAFRDFIVSTPIDVLESL